MINSLIFKSLPYLFILLFIFFEFTPDYLLDDNLIKPYMFFTVLYCWVNNDYRKFSPFSLLFLCTLYDLLNGDIIGITCLFFLFYQYSRRKQFNELIILDLKETWVKYILMLKIKLTPTYLLFAFDTKSMRVRPYPFAFNACTHFRFFSRFSPHRRRSYLVEPLQNA